MVGTRKMDYPGQERPPQGAQSGVSKVTSSRAGKPKLKDDLRSRRSRNIAARNTKKKELEALGEKLQKAESDLENPNISDEEKQRLRKTINDSAALRQDLESQIKDIDQEMEIDEEGQERVIEEEREEPGLHTVGGSKASDNSDNSNSLFFSQTRPENGGSTGVPEEDYEEPSRFDDFPEPDLIEQEERISFLPNGITLAETKTKGGSNIYLNSYGPKNSAVLFWESSPASRKAEEVITLRGKYNQQIMKEDDYGNLIYKGRIASVKKIGWQPKQEIQCMEDLLHAREELNPSNKEDNPKYRFEFSTVLVTWTAGNPPPPPPALISRSDYKRLSSTGKASNKRIDRKFYAQASDQVENFIKYYEGRRIGNNMSPTPMKETPAPEWNRNNTNRQALKGRNRQSITDQNAARQNNKDDQKPIEQAAHSIKNEDEEPEPISEFYGSFMVKNKLDPNLDWTQMDDALFARFKAAAKIYIRDLKKRDIQVTDDMNFGRALKI